MIDKQWLRESFELLRVLVHKKSPNFPVDHLINAYDHLRQVQQRVEALRQQKNELAKKAQQGVTPELRQQSIAVGKELKEKEQELQSAQDAFKELYMACPNLPHEDVPAGDKEQNVVVKTVGEKPTYDFSVRNHLALAESLGWLDFQTAAKMTGSNFALYKGDAVKMLYALSMMMLKNNVRHGFSPVLPPEMVNATSLEVAGTFPKFKDQVYAIPEDQLYMTPTAEVNLTNMYRDHIFMADELPVRMTAWTSCFRREGGAYGATERGLIRLHQFEKVELYTLCEPQYGEQELDKMITCAEAILQDLGLHYRISLLAAQDCSFQSAKTYDIEVWLPGQGEYYEVSSCSLCTDFQARRGKMRYKAHADANTEFVYTLNASSLALPRLMVALIETYQQADGSVYIPDVLRKEGLFS